MLKVAQIDGKYQVKCDLPVVKNFTSTGRNSALFEYFFIAARGCSIATLEFSERTPGT